jgi:phage/plasmid-like protein (TIGR03299 family)
MSANIEIREGMASFAENGRKQRAWHKLGQVFDRPMTVKEALEASHADYRVDLQTIFAVTPAIAEAMNGGSVPTDLLLQGLVKGKKATMRMDRAEALGIVGDTYGVVQNLDAFTFIDTLCTGQLGNHVPVIECAGVLGRGERVFITAKFPESVILDNKGADRVEMYMVFTTSHDGTGAVKCLVTPTRVVCNNTLNTAIANNKGMLSLRHSSNIMQRLDLTSKENTEFAFKALNLMDVYKRSLEEQFARLRSQRLYEKQIEAIVAEVALSEKDYALYAKADNVFHDEISSRGRNTYTAIRASLENGVGQEYGEAGTGMWLVNGLTTYYQNAYEFRSDEAKFNSIMDGNARGKLLTAVRRLERL